jgi:phospholipid/cholesterol/gamma-HCH transport system substrate-binding protein
MQRTKNDVWVGLFVLLGGLALLFLALQSANLLNLSFQTNYRLVAKFDNIGGLKPKAAVKSAGVVVGRVESITFDDKSFQARVLLAMDNRFTFPKDSALKILTSGLLVSTTQSAVVLENLISQFLYSKAAESHSTGSKP